MGGWAGGEAAQVRQVAALARELTVSGRSDGSRDTRWRHHGLVRSQQGSRAIWPEVAPTPLRTGIRANKNARGHGFDAVARCHIQSRPRASPRGYPVIATASRARARWRKGVAGGGLFRNSIPGDASRRSGTSEGNHAEASVFATEDLTTSRIGCTGRASAAIMRVPPRAVRLDTTHSRKQVALGSVPARLPIKDQPLVTLRCVALDWLTLWYACTLTSDSILQGSKFQPCVPLLAHSRVNSMCSGPVVRRK